MILPSLCWTSLSVYTNLCDLSSLLSPLTRGLDLTLLASMALQLDFTFCHFNDYR